MKTKIVAGLGNPFKQYLNTRHNMGVMAVAHLKNNIKTRFRVFRAETYRRFVHDNLVLVQPLTYMNLSGIAVKSAIKKHLRNPDFDLQDNLLIVVDDVNLPFGKVRFRRSGSDGGHNGLKSIIDQLSTEEFGRLRIGVGPSEKTSHAIELERYVLAKFTDEETRALKPLLKLVSEAIMHWYASGIDSAMNKYNGSLLEPDDE